MDEIELEPEGPLWEPEPRSKTPTEPTFQTYGPDGPDGQSWHEYFLAIRDGYKSRAKDAEEESETGFEILETGVTDGDLTGTQKDVVKQAELAGFNVKVYHATVKYLATIQKTDGKRADAGAVISPEVTVTNTFIEGRVPDSVLAFKSGWTGRGHKFSGFVSDPIGRYVDVPGVDARDRLREVQWMISGSMEFQAWIDEWRGALTGVSKKLEKSTKLEEKNMNKSLREMKAEMDSDRTIGPEGDQ